MLAARALQEFEKFTSQAEAKKNLLHAVEAVARMLGNTPAICRRCYVHPLCSRVTWMERWWTSSSVGLSKNLQRT